MNFLKHTQVNMAQIRRDLDKKYHALFLALTTDLKLKSENMVNVTMTDVKIWHGSKSRKIFAAFRKKLEVLGFWIKTKTNWYMINPLALNNAKPENVSVLYKKYLAIGGVKIILDDHLKLRKETVVVMNYESLLAKDYENAINAAIGKALREKEEAMEAVKEMKIEMKQMNKNINLILAMLTPDQKKEVERHLKLVKE